MDYYADLALDYDWILPEDALSASTVGLTSPGSEQLIQRALDMLPRGALVLDCACGTGLDAVALARAGFRVTASDGSERMVARARDRFYSNGLDITCVQAQWTELPSKVRGPFELVLCTGNFIVHAGSGMVEALSGIRDVTALGGSLIVDSRNWESLGRERPRIMTAPRVVSRDGVESCWLYIWTIPDDPDDTYRADIVVLFKQSDGSLSHRRYTINFRPFRHTELLNRLRSVGFRVLDTSYTPSQPFYAILAQRS